MSFFNLDLEKTVLASLMSIEDSYLAVSHILTPSDFYARRHQIIFGTIASLSDKNQPYDAVMVADKLQGELENVGGEEYLGELLNSPASKFNLVPYAKRVREMSALRQAEQSLTTGKDVLTQEGEYSDKINTIVESLTTIVDEKTTMKGAETVSQLLPEFFKQLQDFVHSGQTPFVKTGFVELDNKVNIQAGELVIVAGRPAMGKTTLAQNILQNIVENTKGIGVFFSLEMAKSQVMQRFMSSTAGVHLSKVKSGQGLDEHDYSRMTDVVVKFDSDFKLFIDDRTALTISQMRSTLNKIRNKNGKISVIMVDYIQIMGGITGNTAGERSASIGKISMALKNFSKEYDCPVIALSQLNRDSEKRPDRKPVMADLKESGAIEQDADHIWAIYREEVAKPTKENKGLAEIIVLKQRQGAIGTVHLGFQGHYSRFTDFIPQEDQNPFLEASQ